ncbi:hypothetical protein [Piscirickettsia litoralis]|uniref:Uncharacterized protein n=1 Tax=Piscirickettsia litoralis TaxID=1891921 RepID=A0ABX3A5I5_9GAMM|nr:hypothetical protein [Piscirickettsia litoralis]ODN42695.1 hypothetical protein BGC07_06875 [Piscirickettsia litoralis]
MSDEDIDATDVDIDSIIAAETDANEIDASEIDETLEAAIETDAFVESWQAPSFAQEEVRQSEPLVISDYDKYDHWQIPGLSANIEKDNKTSQFAVDEDDKVSWPNMTLEGMTSAEQVDHDQGGLLEATEELEQDVIEDVTMTAADLEELQKKLMKRGFPWKK